MTYVIPHIGVTNLSTVVTDAEVAAAVPAFQKQITYHLRPAWGATASISSYPKGAAFPTDRLFWPALILDDSDQAGALGYHDTDANRPTLKVFAKTDQQYGLSWTVTLSHEYLEELVDPYVSAMTQTSDTTAYATEVGDPVEADSDGYTIPDASGQPVLVSDFIWPSWLIPGYTGRVDQAKRLTTALSVRPQGYVSICHAQSGKFVWTQYQQQKGSLVPVAATDPDDHAGRPITETSPAATRSRQDGTGRRAVVDHPRFRDHDKPRHHD